MTICVGVPTEIKPQERRVALTPAAVAELVRVGAQVCVQAGAGLGSGYSDQAYAQQGASVLDYAQAVYAKADILLKVKEPVEPEVDYLRPGQRLFSFLHLAAAPGLSQRLCELGVTAIAFETVADRGGLPILQPMSEIAGKIAVQVGTHLLHASQQGSGLLLGGVPGVERGRVVVLGAGVAGGSAARLAAAIGAQVTVFDLDPRRLGQMQQAAANIEARYANHDEIQHQVAQADLLIGAVLLPGAAAPRLVNEATVRAMRNGSVLVDISVDQGGCIATTRATSYDEPTYQVGGVTHFCVSNMPGAVPRTATQALTGALLPYLKLLLRDDWREQPVLRAAINVEQGKLVHPALLGR